MGKYVYEFQRLGVLFRSNGIAVMDAYGNYIAGEPHFVWWWPINWIVIVGHVPVYLWRAFKDRYATHPKEPE